MKMWSYRKFWTMILVSWVAMYLVMYANVYEFSHMYTATMRVYMTLLMMVPMIVIMLWFMRTMYPWKQTKRTIIWCSLITWLLIFGAIRNQTWISDVQRMKAMIPHHSSAILTSSNATFEDPRVQQLAEEIIEAQKKEITEMKLLIKELQ